MALVKMSMNPQNMDALRAEYNMSYMSYPNIFGAEAFSEID